MKVFYFDGFPLFGALITVAISTNLSKCQLWYHTISSSCSYGQCMMQVQSCGQPAVKWFRVARLVVITRKIVHHIDCKDATDMFWKQSLNKMYSWSECLIESCVTYITTAFEATQTKC